MKAFAFQMGKIWIGRMRFASIWNLVLYTEVVFHSRLIRFCKVGKSSLANEKKHKIGLVRFRRVGKSNFHEVGICQICSIRLGKCEIFRLLQKCSFQIKVNQALAKVEHQVYLIFSKSKVGWWGSEGVGKLNVQEVRKFLIGWIGFWKDCFFFVCDKCNQGYSDFAKLENQVWRAWKNSKLGW